MSFTMGVFTFLNAWFIALFLAFPFNIEPPDEGEAAEGYAAAPKRIRWKRLTITATLLALAFTLLLALLIKSGIVPIRGAY